jgi:hypothetical protein
MLTFVACPFPPQLALMEKYERPVPKDDAAAAPAAETSGMSQEEAVEIIQVRIRPHSFKMRFLFFDIFFCFRRAPSRGGIGVLSRLI